MRKGYLKEFVKDLFILATGIAVTVFLVNIGFVAAFLELTKGMQILASFVAGGFFTSVFTIAPASVALSALVTKMHPVDVAFWGALGAAMVDYVIFIFVREGVSKNISHMFTRSVRRKLVSLFHFGFMRWFVALLAGFIIASPLPDELGIALLGFSKIKPHQFILLTFVMNFFGIWALTSAVRTIL
jgi:hypothetical protein